MARKHLLLAVAALALVASLTWLGTRGPAASVRPAAGCRALESWETAIYQAYFDAPSPEFAAGSSTSRLVVEPRATFMDDSSIAAACKDQDLLKKFKNRARKDLADLSTGAFPGVHFLSPRQRNDIMKTQNSKDLEVVLQAQFPKQEVHLTFCSLILCSGDKALFQANEFVGSGFNPTLITLSRRYGVWSLLKRQPLTSYGMGGLPGATWSHGP